MTDFEKAAIMFRTPDCSNCGMVIQYCCQCGRDMSEPPMWDAVYCDGLEHECPDCKEAEGLHDTDNADYVTDSLKGGKK